MRPLLFILGFLLVVYLIASWINGTLQYSFEGYIGSGVFWIGNIASPGFMSLTSFMDIVYVLTFLLGIVMMYGGISGEGGKQ